MKLVLADVCAKGLGGGVAEFEKAGVEVVGQLCDVSKLGQI